MGVVSLTVLGLRNQPNCRNLLCALLVSLCLLPECLQMANAQSVQTQNLSAGQSLQASTSTTQLAQVPPPVTPLREEIPSPSVLPTDLTPQVFYGKNEILSRELRYRVLRSLPERLWFNTSTEVSNRLETNVLMTHGHGYGDYVFRVLPSATVGWNIFSKTSAYCNYFMVKDVFTRQYELNNPTTQSVGMGLRHDLPTMLNNRLATQLDVQVRELWQASHLRQADMLPTLNLTYFHSNSVVLFGSTVLQMRSRNIFQAATRELDPFYTVGAVFRHGKWVFTASDTLVTNFRSPPFHYSIPGKGNCSMICDFELAHPIANRLKGVVAFVRVEPVFNWSSHKIGGLSGNDVRVFGGIRFAASKPSYTASVDNIRDQLIKQEMQRRKSSSSSLNDPGKGTPIAEAESSAL